MLAIQSELKQRANNQVRWIVGSGAPTNGVTGVNDCGPGSLYTDFLNSVLYENTGTAASPVWTLMIGASVVQQLSGQISSANITGVAAGQFGNANGYPLIPAPPAGQAILLDSVLASYQFNTAAYTAGGNTTANWAGGGAALTGLVSAANFAGAASSKPVLLVDLSTAGIPLLAATGINLVTSAAFTQPGTAAGVINWVATFAIVTL